RSWAPPRRPTCGPPSPSSAPRAPPPSPTSAASEPEYDGDGPAAHCGRSCESQLLVVGSPTSFRSRSEQASSSVSKKHSPVRSPHGGYVWFGVGVTPRRYRGEHSSVQLPRCPSTIDRPASGEASGCHQQSDATHASED